MYTSIVNNVSLVDIVFYFPHIIGLTNNVSCYFNHLHAKCNVSEHPNVRLVPSSQQVTEESSVRFDCHAHGKPKPYVKWLHNGEDVGLDVTITYTGNHSYRNFYL